MELEKSIIFRINDFNSEFRSLNESDVSQNYIDGLKEQKEYVENIPVHVSASSQKKYINDINVSKENTICGLFLNRELVGTSGVQLSTSFLRDVNVPIENIATIGIFLVSKNFRGMGLGKTLVWSATRLFHDATQIDWFGAGMAKRNIPSLKSFLSCGFRKVYENEKNCRVLLNYSELMKPDLITDEAIRKVDLRSSSRLVDRLS